MRTQKSKYSRPSNHTLAPNLVVPGRYANIRLNLILGLRPAFHGYANGAIPRLPFTLMVMPTDGGRFFPLQPIRVLEHYLKGGKYSEIEVFIVGELPSEQHKQGLIKYCRHVQASFWSFLSPSLGTTKHPSTGGCKHMPKGCLMPACGLRTLLSEPAILESIALLIKGEHTKFSDPELVALFEGRISLSMVARVRAAVKKESTPNSNDLDTEQTPSSAKPKTRKSRKGIKGKSKASTAKAGKPRHQMGVQQSLFASDVLK